MSENFQMNTCWLIRVFQMTTRRFHSNLWNGKQCLNNNLTSLMSTRWLLDNYWMITFEADRSWGSQKIEKLYVRKTMAYLKLKKLGKSHLWEKQWYIMFLIVCMGYFIKRNCAKCQERWAGIFLSNLRLLEGMGLALRPKAISRNTIYICYNFQNEIIFQKDRKNRPIKNVFRFWISDCIKLKYSSVNNIIMESKLLWSQVDILIHPDFILRIIRTVERMPLLDLGISLKSNYRISLNNE